MVAVLVNATVARSKPNVSRSWQVAQCQTLRPRLRFSKQFSAAFETLHKIDTDETSWMYILLPIDAQVCGHDSCTISVPKATDISVWHFPHVSVSVVQLIKWTNENLVCNAGMLQTKQLKLVAMHNPFICTSCSLISRDFLFSFVLVTIFC